MSPNTTPSAAKLKPAAPIAEMGLTFSAEVLVTEFLWITAVSSPTPIFALGSGRSHHARSVRGSSGQNSALENVIDLLNRNIPHYPHEDY